MISPEKVFRRNFLNFLKRKFVLKQKTSKKGLLEKPLKLLVWLSIKFNTRIQNLGNLFKVKPAEQLLWDIQVLEKICSRYLIFFHFGRAAISSIISETCNALYYSPRNPYLKTWQLPEEWRDISKVFEEKWNFPHVIGALHGKHIKNAVPETKLNVVS